MVDQTLQVLDSYRLSHLVLVFAVCAELSDQILTHIFTPRLDRTFANPRSAYF
jgi:hypothetical protein